MSLRRTIARFLLKDARPAPAVIDDVHEEKLVLDHVLDEVTIWLRWYVKIVFLLLLEVYVLSLMVAFNGFRF
jgi:hypothetical protein